MNTRRSATVRRALSVVGGCLLLGICNTALAWTWVAGPDDGWRSEQAANCRGIKVVDAQKRPIDGATVTLWAEDPDKVKGVSGRGWETDGRGIVCDEDLFEGGYLEVHAPPRMGGWCTGRRVLRLNARSPVAGRPSVTRVILNTRAIARSSWRGRVLSPEGNPVAGATVRIGVVVLGTCTEHIDDIVTTAADGTFTLPTIPHGDYAIVVHHKAYADRHFDVKVPGSPRDLVVDRGAVWIGRVLDPDGGVIDAPQMVLRKPGDDIVGTVDVTATGFALKLLPPGDFTLSVAIDKHPTLGDRTLTMKVTIEPNEQRHQDIHWPGGATISGEAITATSGRPLAGTRIQALPPGAWERVNQRHPDEVNVTTDRDGRFVSRHLPPGNWALRIRGQHATTTVPTGTTDVRLVR